jgi:UDP-3-O-[3-hydroxymyristoyl] glucosamine N-acyltransferase
MVLNAAQLCELLQGELIGDGGKKVYGPSQIDKGRPGTITFLANPKYEEYAYTTEADVIVVSKDFVPKELLRPAVIKVPDVYGAMMLLIDTFSKNGIPGPGISDTAILHNSIEVADDISIGHYAVIEAGVTVGKRTIIYPQVFVGHGCMIGEDVIIYPGVRLYPNTQVGNRCIIHANAVIGCDGFGYRPNAEGHYQKIGHVGFVLLEEDVEIGANTVIDRGTLNMTRIGKGTKIDNLVQVAHNVTIGEHTVIAAQAGIAGSATVGSFVKIGGQAGIAGHIKVENNIEIQAQSGVHTGKNKEGSRLFGSPAIDYTDYLKSYAVFKQLPEMIKRLEELERKSGSEKTADQ